MKKIIQLLLLTTLPITILSCQSDIEEDGITTENREKIVISGGTIYSPEWLVKATDSISTAEGITPWVFKLTKNEDAYIAIFNPANDGETVFTTSGERISLDNMSSQWNRNLIWRGEQHKLTTKTDIIFTPVNIYTPYGSLVSDSYTASEIYLSSDYSALYAMVESTFSQAQVVGPMSSTYNCHGYSLAMNGMLSNPVWVGKDYLTTEDIYWDDNSYIETTESDATVVSYQLDNHSARTTSTPDIYISKWGLSYPLVRHSRYYSPYNSNSLKFYKRNPKPAYYIGRNSNDYTSSSTNLIPSGGSADISLYAYTATDNVISQYQWSAEFYGTCDRWYIWPSSNRADISIYTNNPDNSGTLRIACRMYSGSSLLQTVYYYIYLMPQS